MLRLTIALTCCGALAMLGEPGAQAAVKADTCLTEGCCPTYDPNVDCWAEGHWHYNHCKNACT